MKVFVFGAGASVGSQEDGSQFQPHRRAPMVDSLFDLVYQTQAASDITVDDLARCRAGIEETRSLEPWLTDQWTRIQKMTSRRTIAAERTFFGRITIYLWRLFLEVSETHTSTSGYSLLMRKLRSTQEEFGIISFNYDTLLDKAFEDAFGTPLLTMSAYFDADFIKPHGSINWLFPPRGEDQLVSRGKLDSANRFRLVASGMFQGNPLPFGQLYVHDPLKPDLNDLPAVFGSFGFPYFYPLLFVPLTTKLYPMVDTFYPTIIEKGKQLLGTADEVYLVGYRAKDDVIHEMLHAARDGTKLNIICIDRFQGDDIMSSVLDRNTSDNGGIVKLQGGRIWHSGFMDFVKQF